MLRRKHRPRPGVASVELAAVFLFFVIPMMIGIWEVGRLIQVQQLVANSAREGARLASQGYTVNSSGSPTQITVNSGTPNVTDTVYQYLYAAGLTSLQKSDVKVDFKFTPASGYDTSPTEPYQGLKNQPFSVTVTVQWSKVRWIDLGIIKPTTVSFTVDWQMLIDDKFTVNQSIPQW